LILSKTERDGEGEVEPNKILIFSEWTDVLDVLEYFLKLRNISSLRFDGTVEENTKKRNLKKFPNRDSPPILLISLHAGGVGLNLQCANYVILVEPYWNRSMEDQAITRSFRIGQKRPVKVIHFIADQLFGKSSIEQHVQSLQERKSLHSSVFFQNTLNDETPFPQLALGYKRIVEYFESSLLDWDDVKGASPNNCSNCSSSSSISDESEDNDSAARVDDHEDDGNLFDIIDDDENENLHVAKKHRFDENE
jgi:hypothetical protein